MYRSEALLQVHLLFCSVWVRDGLLESFRLPDDWCWCKGTHTPHPPRGLASRRVQSPMTSCDCVGGTQNTHTQTHTHTHTHIYTQKARDARRSRSKQFFVPIGSYDDFSDSFGRVYRILPATVATAAGAASAALLKTTRARCVPHMALLTFSLPGKLRHT